MDKGKRLSWCKCTLYFDLSLYSLAPFVYPKLETNTMSSWKQIENIFGYCALATTIWYIQFVTRLENLNQHHQQD
jgi:hypothetical protein